MVSKKFFNTKFFEAFDFFTGKKRKKKKKERHLIFSGRENWLLPKISVANKQIHFHFSGRIIRHIRIILFFALQKLQFFSGSTLCSIKWRNLELRAIFTSRISATFRIKMRLHRETACEYDPEASIGIWYQKRGDYYNRKVLLNDYIKL